MFDGFYRNRVKRRIKVADPKRFLAFVAALVIIIVVIIALSSNKGDSSYKPSELNSDNLWVYFNAQETYDVAWYFLAAVDLAEEIEVAEVERTAGIAANIQGIFSMDDINSYFDDYSSDAKLLKKIKEEAYKLQDMDLIVQGKVFPFQKNEIYSYQDDFGDPRIYGGERTHEGIDIMSNLGIPVRSVSFGTVEKIGWLEMGGWRIGIRSGDGIYYYYAHLSEYVDGMEVGTLVEPGTIMGYAGDSGYGPEGTTGEFEPHLHFGMLEGKKETPVNPYPFLLLWEMTEK